jgi:divalent metal cation (Fe/Co/Zn/Cd) transporter
VALLPIPLVQRSKEEIEERIKRKVETIKEVEGVHQLDVRLSGKRIDVTMLLSFDSNLSWEDAHKIAHDVEREVTREFPDARVTVNTEPANDGQESIWKLVKETAEGTSGSRGIHNIHIQRIDDRLCVDLHLEVSANMTVKQAHDVADQVEKKIKAASKDISEVTVHIETASERVSREMAGVQTELDSYIEHLAERFPEIKEVRGIRVRRFGDTTHLVLQCRFDPNLSIEKAHQIASKFEKEIRSDYPNVTRIDIHEEPA